VIRGNIGGGAWLEGACVDCCLSTMHLTRCVIVENNGHRGAIQYTTHPGYPTRSYATQTGRLYIEDSLICDNLSAYGGPIMLNNWLITEPGYDDMLSVKRCTIVGNRAWENHAYDLYVIGNGYNVDFQDNVIAGNDGRLFWRAPGNSSSTGRYFYVGHCCLQEEFEGEGNFEADPLFVSGPLGDYYLSSVEAGQEADSPCIDAGSTSASIAGVSHLTTRTDGAFDTGVVDIGYHYSATPPTIVCQITTGGTVAAILDEAPVLRPGDTLSAQVTVQNDGWTFWADVFAAFIAADGTVFYITPNGLTSAFTPYAIDVRLDDGLHFGPAPVFEFALNEHVPTGDYIFATALSRAREPFRPIGDIAFASFAVSS